MIDVVVHRDHICQLRRFHITWRRFFVSRNNVIGQLMNQNLARSAILYNNSLCSGEEL